MSGDLDSFKNNGLDCSAALQALLDVPNPVVTLSPGFYTLNRPVVVRRDGTKIVGLPYATLKSSGAFSPLIIGMPKPERRPGFIRPHRAANSLTADPNLFSYALNGDSYLALPSSPFEVGPATNWPDCKGFTLAFALHRDAENLASADDILSTRPDLFGPDPLDVFLVDGRLEPMMKTNDGVSRRLQWELPPGARELDIVIAVDFETGSYSAYHARKALAPYRHYNPASLGPDWKPGLRLAWPELAEARVGRNPNFNPAKITLHGLKLSPTAIVPTGVVAGTDMVRKDNRAITPDTMLWSVSQGEVALDMRRSSLSSEDSELAAYRGGLNSATVGYGLLLPSNWNPYDVTSKVEVRSLGLSVKGDYQGASLLWGSILNLKVRDCDFLGGVNGIRNMDGPTSYVSTIDGCSFAGQGDAPLVLNFGIVNASNLTFGTGPAGRSRYVVKNRRANGWITDVFVAELSTIVDVVRVGRLESRLALERWHVDFESTGPAGAYVRTERGQAGSSGQVSTLVLREFECSRAPRDGKPYIVATDPFNGRTDVGLAKLLIEDSFSAAWPGPLLSTQGIWVGNHEVKGKMAAGVSVPDPVVATP